MRVSDRCYYFIDFTMRVLVPFGLSHTRNLSTVLPLLDRCADGSCCSQFGWVAHRTSIAMEFETSVMSATFVSAMQIVIAY